MAKPAVSSRVTLAGRSELRRYSRHLLIPEVGLAGQERLAGSRALIIGAGGLGSPVLQYLAAAGVGRIGVVDDDVVDETNLQRQTIFAQADVGEKKALVAAKFARALNPLIAVDAFPLRFDATNASDLVASYDVAIDCTDRFSTRYLINDACVLAGKPDIYASIFRFDGQVSVFGAAGGPCYRCLFPDPPPVGAVPTCAEGGVLGVLAGLVGAWQANEAMKMLLGIGEPLIGRLLLVESLGATTREVRFERDPHCAVCGTNPSILHPSLAEQIEDRDEDDVESSELDDVLASAQLLDVREPHEVIVGRVDGAMHIPASELEARLHELDLYRTYVVACRVGMKSLWAVRRLREAGFTKVRHLHGGLLAYAGAHEDFPFFLMRTKPFGSGGIALPIIGQGSWDLPESGAAVATAKSALLAGIKLGMTHLDTAEMYGSGAVERILGDVLRGVRRESVFVASKVLPSNASYKNTILACDRSLKRLGLEYVDLYMLHWPSHIPLEETMGALADLARSGKARFVGVSNFDVDEMLEARELLGDVPLACNQVLYHLKERAIEHRLIPAAKERDIAIVAYTPFGRGRFPRDAAKPDGILGKIATKHGVTARAVILAFLTREENVFAIPKASSVAHVEENAAAGDLVLDVDDIAAIDAVFPVGDDRPLATI